MLTFTLADGRTAQAESLADFVDQHFDRNVPVDAVLVATDTGDEPDTLISDADGMVDDIEALLRQATGAPLRVSAIYLLEYEGHPILVWEATP